MKINLDDYSFDVKIEYKDIKNIYLRLKDDSHLLITCNKKINEEYIYCFLNQRKSWILKQRDKYLFCQKTSKRLITDKIYYLGKPYSINITLSSKNKINFVNNVYYIQVKENDINIVYKLFYEYHKKDYEALLNKIRIKYDLIMDDYKIKHPIIKIKTLKGKHGYCIPLKGEIAMAKHLIHYDIECIEYVLWHEYCHLIVPNHSKRFYDVLSFKMSNYKEIKQKLI